MKDLTTIKDGSGVEATLLIDGELVKFELAIIKDRRRFTLSEKDGALTLAFVSKDRKFLITGSFYSGGSTGFGRDKRDLEQLDALCTTGEVQIVTTDLDKIKRMGEEAVKEHEEAAQKREENEHKTVERVNTLPTSFAIAGIPELVVKRTAAAVCPMRKHADWFVHLANVHSVGRSIISLEEYRTKDGKLLIKRWKENAHWVLGLDRNRVHDLSEMHGGPKGLLQYLLDQVKDVKDKVRAVANDTTS